MKTIFLSILLVVFAGFSTQGLAQEEVEKTLDAVVEIRITVPEDARTAERFGTNRVASGVVIDEAGHVLTIGFQTIEAESVEIVLKGGQRIMAAVVGYDRNTGFGLLRAASPLKVAPMPLGRSSDLKERDQVLVVSSGGEEAAQGTVIVARKEFAGPWEYLLENAIFTAPPIAEFSGAALVNRDGHLVGIGYLLSRLTVPGLGLMATNMFVPIDILKPILDNMIRSGRSGQPDRPWLGVRTEEFYGRLFVQGVRPGGPFEKAGIRSGDIILAVNQQAVKGMADFYRKVWALGEAGVDVPLSILQGTQIRQVVVHSSAQVQYRQPDRKKKPSGTEL